MAEKSHKLGGTRTKGRHVGELGAGGALALLIVSMFPESWELDAFQMNLFGVVLTGTFSTMAKVFHEAGGLSRIIGSIGLVSLLSLSLVGCAGSLGRSTPEFKTGGDGETIVACETVGVQWAFGSASVCRNIEGGHVGRDFANIVTGSLGMAMRALGGVFTGFGSVGTVLSAASPEPVVVAAEVEAPAIVYEPEQAEEPDFVGPSLPQFFTDE